MEQSNPPTKAIIGIIVVVLLVIAATATVIATSNNKPDVASTATDSTSPTANDGSQGTPAVAASTTLKDGTYTATAQYDSPGGTQSITVKLTIAGNSVTDSSLQQTATAREDEEYESAFEASYKSGVVGKKVSDISLSRVAGASLTTNGFNSALADIAKQAQA